MKAKSEIINNLNLQESKEYYDSLIRNRRDLHKIPELGFQEFKTSNYIYNEIKDYVDKIYKIATTGIVAYIHPINNNKTKTLLLRADIDGLPIQEENNIDYKSEHNGIMHACGHDAHSSILINTIKYFYKNKDKLKINLKFIFQPGEEGFAGAKKMIDEGVLDDVDYATALHVWNDLDIKKVAIEKGASMASSDSFEIELIGKGGHAAIPYQSHDPILTATNFINYCYSYFPRAFNTPNNYILSFTYIQAGTANNIIPSKLILKGTVRTFDENIRINIASKLDEILKTFCNLNNIDYILKYNLGYPVLINDPFLYDIAYKALEKIGVKIEKFKSMGSEDMAYIFQKVPGIYVAIGSKDEVNNAPHHNPKFNINENSMLIGMQYFINFILTLQESI